MASKTYDMGNVGGQRRIAEERFEPQGDQEYVGPSRGSGSGPVAQWRSGEVQVAVWERHHARKDGRGEFSSLSVSVQRRYKDRDGNWQSTSSFDKQHLAALRYCLAKAEEFILIGSKNHEEAEQ